MTTGVNVNQFNPRSGILDALPNWHPGVARNAHKKMTDNYENELRNVLMKGYYDE